jgi:hypothetical protein
MAKKKENQLTYLQSPLPEGRKSYRMTKRSWSGLNYRQTIDTGALSKEKNISTLEAPYLVPSQARWDYLTSYVEEGKEPFRMFGFDDFLLVVYRDSGDIKVDYVRYDEENDETTVYTGLIKSNDESSRSELTCCVVQFNAYDYPTDVIEGEYVKRLLFFPFKVAMFMNIVDVDSNPAEWPDEEVEAADDKVLYCYDDGEKKRYYEIKTEDGEKAVELNGKNNYFICDEMGSDTPDIKYATVHLSRLFGVDDTRIYASGYNDYTNWVLDDVDGYNESNAWCSPAQSNTKAGGEFTGITNFQGHIVCFKRDYMHEIYNTKNPFRIQDIYAEGAIDSRTIQDVDGKLIFVSEDAVKIYTGSNPRIISYNLNIDKFARAVSGTDGRCYYLYCEDAKRSHRLFTYDTFTDCWSEQDAPEKVLSFAHNKNGMFMLCDDSIVYRLDTANYDLEWSFETDLITNQTVDIKHLKKIQMLVDIPEKVGAFDNKKAQIDVYVLYGDETFNAASSHHVYHCEDSGRKAIRVKPRNKKNASYGIKLHIEGKKYVKLYEMELFIEQGGDLYV